MVEKIADLYLPNSVVARLIKDAIPEGISIGKEARLAIAKAASIFSKYSKICFRGTCALVKWAITMCFFIAFVLSGPQLSI